MAVNTVQDNRHGFRILVLSIDLEFTIARISFFSSSCESRLEYWRGQDEMAR
jgi:hypothetical protein